MAVTAYTRGIEAITSGAVNIGAVTVKAMLTTAPTSRTRRPTSSESQVTNEVRRHWRLHDGRHQRVGDRLPRRSEQPG